MFTIEDKKKEKEKENKKAFNNEVKSPACLRSMSHDI
jgi:hypothetical protein